MICSIVYRHPLCAVQHQKGSEIVATMNRVIHKGLLHNWYCIGQFSGLGGDTFHVSVNWILDIFFMYGWYGWNKRYTLSDGKLES